MLEKMRLCLLVVLFSLACSVPSFASDQEAADYNAWNESLLAASSGDESGGPTIQAYVNGRSVGSVRYYYQYQVSSDYFIVYFSEGSLSLPALSAGSYSNIGVRDFYSLDFSYPFTVTLVFKNVDPDLFSSACLYSVRSDRIPVPLIKSSDSVMCSYTFDSDYDTQYSSLRLYFVPYFSGPLIGEFYSTAELFDMTYMFKSFTEIFHWILSQGAVLLSWMLDKPVLMVSFGLFFCIMILVFLHRICRSL